MEAIVPGIKKLDSLSDVPTTAADLVQKARVENAEYADLPVQLGRLNGYPDETTTVKNTTTDTTVFTLKVPIEGTGRDAVVYAPQVAVYDKAHDYVVLKASNSQLTSAYASYQRWTGIVKNPGPDNKIGTWDEPDDSSTFAISPRGSEYYRTMLAYVKEQLRPLGVELEWQ